MLFGGEVTYRGTIDAVQINISGTVAPDDAVASPLVERVRANTLTIGEDGLLVAEELLVGGTLTIAQNGRFQQSGVADLQVNNLELDGFFEGQSLTVGQNLRVGSRGTVTLRNRLTVAGELDVQGFLNANILEADVAELFDNSRISARTLVQIQNDLQVNGTLEFSPEPDGPRPVGDIGGDLSVGSGGEITGQADLSVGGDFDLSVGANLMLDGDLIIEGDANLDGTGQSDGLAAGGDIDFDDTALISGSDEQGLDFLDFVQQLIDIEEAQGGAPSADIDPEDIDLAAGGNLTVGPSANVGVEGGTLVSADFVVGEDASFQSTGLVAGFGNFTTEEGSTTIVEGSALIDGNVDFDGVQSLRDLLASGDFNLGNDTNINGGDDDGPSFRELISGDFSSIDLGDDQLDDSEFNLATGGNLTVGPLADVGVDGGTLVSVDFEIGADASFSSTGSLVGFGDFASGEGSQTTVEGSAFVGGSAQVSGSSSFSQLIVGDDADFDEGGVYLHGFGDLEPVVDGEGQIDFSVPLDAARTGAEDLADAIDGDGLGAALDDGSFGFSAGSFAFGAFGDVTIGEGATFTSDGDAFTGGSLNNAGDAFFNGDLLTGFDTDQPGNALENGEGAQLIVSGSLGVAGDFQNAGRLSVQDNLIVSGGFNNDGSGVLEFGGIIVLRDDAELINSGTLIGGRNEPGFDLEQFNISAAIVTNGGFFGGAGTVEGDFIQQVQQDAAGLPTLSPGFSPGIINITGDATFNDGVVLFEIGGLTPGTEHDQINVGGNLTIGSNAMIVVDLLELADGSGIFLPRTGDEIVLFTASDITPDDVEQINFAVIDDLPLGFTLVPDIARTDSGEIFRVLRGFDGSQLATLGDLNAGQLAVAGALDVLSTADSGVPSADIFELAVELQFTDDPSGRLDSLTALGASSLSAMQDTAMQAGSIGMTFAQRRLRAQAVGLAVPEQPARNAGAASAPVTAVPSSASYQGGTLDRAATAAFVAQRASRGGGTEFLAGDGSILRIIGATSYMFGNSDKRSGAIGFDYDGWSANAAAEFESARGDLLLGGALSLGTVEADLDNSLGEVKTDSFAATLYGQYTAGPLSIALGYSVADLDIESERQVRGALATGEVDGDIQHLFSRVGVDVVRTEGWTFGPKAELVQSDLELDALTESGAGALDLVTRAFDRDATRLNLAARWAREFDTQAASGAVTLGVGYQFALSGDEFITNSVAFAPAPTVTFDNPLRPLQNSGLKVDAGVDLVTKSGIGVGLHYNALLAEKGQHLHDLSLNLSVQF